MYIIRLFIIRIFPYFIIFIMELAIRIIMTVNVTNLCVFDQSIRYVNIT